MLPKAVALAEALRGRRLHRGARRRPHRRGGGAARRALRPRRGARPRGRPAGGRARRRCASGRCASSRRPATPPRCLLEPRGGRALPPRARRSARGTTAPTRARIGEKLGDVSLRLGRVDEAIGVWHECLDWHRGQEDLERVADLHRKIGAALSHKGERKRRDRALPEGHQPAEGRPAAARARAPLRGGRLALPAHRRQHARDLRVREGAAAGRAAGRDARRQPRARDLRPRVRAHRRHREGAPEPRARGGAGPRAARHARRARRSWRCRRSAATSRSPRPTWPARARPTRRRSRWPSRWACCPRRSSCTPRSPSWPPTAPTGSSVERSTEASAELAEREGLVGKLCLPYALRGLLRWREGEHRRGHRALPPRPRAGRAGGLVGARLPGAVRAGHRAARLAATWPARSAALDRALDVCERAGPDRPVDPGHGRARGGPGAGPAAARRPPRRPRRPPSWPSACTTRSAARRRSRRAACAPRTRARARRCWTRRPTAWRSSTGRWRPRARGCWPGQVLVGGGLRPRRASCSEAAAEEIERARRAAPVGARAVARCLA